MGVSPVDELVPLLKKADESLRKKLGPSFKSAFKLSEEELRAIAIIANESWSAEQASAGSWKGIDPENENRIRLMKTAPLEVETSSLKLTIPLTDLLLAKMFGPQLRGTGNLTRPQVKDLNAFIDSHVRKPGSSIKRVEVAGEDVFDLHKVSFIYNPVLRRPVQSLRHVRLTLRQAAAHVIPEAARENEHVQSAVEMLHTGKV